ncbi:zf-HC2 domain-containing protein [Amycolatopsis pigmentata]|uniref:Zf-HC2 domain-containing protein n=1 Tax=Amycolatopsis pigmentata TaxID=450801 RepID=A0ABW5G0S6_9PSEU
MSHADNSLIMAYVVEPALLPPDEVWALEGHLESCAPCRRRVAEAVSSHAPAVSTLLDEVWERVDAAAVGRPAPVGSKVSRWLRTWAPPSLVPWLLMSVLVTLTALSLDLFQTTHRLPSLVLLVAPIAPLFGVAAAWSRELDPMGELTAATPRAGLALVLRRTAAVLVVMTPLLVVAGWITGQQPVLCLVPCLAFTLGSLALGTVLGVGRAALALGVLWVAVVVAPSLLTARLSVLLAPASLPFWALAVVLVAVATTVRGHAFATVPPTKH